MLKRIVAIIQASPGSTGLPGKILLPMMDKTILEQIIGRVRSVGGIHCAVAAISDDKLDDIVEKFCRDKGIECFRTNIDNTLERFFLCARNYNAEVIVRINPDTPFIDPEVIAKAIRIFGDADCDYVSNTLEPTYPKGLGIEVFSFSALEKAYLEAVLPSEKEQVTPYIYKHPEKFRLKNFTNDTDLSGLCWTVDSMEDYLFAQKVYEELYKKPDEFFGMDRILKLITEKPELYEKSFGQSGIEDHVKSAQPEKEDLPNKQICKRLEQAFTEKTGTRYAIAMADGTRTLQAILEAADIGPGDEVIVPALTMSDTALAVLQAYAAPVFADVDPDTFLISPSSVKERITPKTKAIITVPLYGLPPDMDAILEAATSRQLLVIEDNAQCMLGTYKGRKAGTLGHAASYSFRSLRQLNCGEGGIAVTNSPELEQRIRRHLSMEWNYCIPELCAAAALGQLENEDYMVKRRMYTAQMYLEALKDSPWLKPQYVGKDYESTYLTFAVKLDHPCIRWGEFRDHFISFGGDKISAIWKMGGFITEENKSRYEKSRCPVAEELQGKLLQFKTDYRNEQDAEKQAEVLRKTIQFFNKWSIRQ